MTLFPWRYKREQDQIETTRQRIADIGALPLSLALRRERAVEWAQKCIAGVDTNRVRSRETRRALVNLACEVLLAEIAKIQRVEEFERDDGIGRRDVDPFPYVGREPRSYISEP